MKNRPTLPISDTGTTARHAVVRHRHETRRRRLTIDRIEQVTPSMRRLIVGGAELAGFKSLAPDDHVKLFVSSVGGESAMRDYTPRWYDEAARLLAIDFAIHEAGPATRWALDAKVGDTIEIGGPRGSAVVPTDFDWWLLVGDETALPAIGRRIEELPAGTPVTSIVAVAGTKEQQAFETAADHRAIWVHRPSSSASDPTALLDALRAFTPPPGEGFVWIAAEAGVTRAARAHVLDVWGHTPAWLKASGYWVHGQPDATEKF